MAIKTKCTHCQGKGKTGLMGRNTCSDCNGKGYILRQETSHDSEDLPTLEYFFERVKKALATKDPEKMRSAQLWLDRACKENGKYLTVMAVQSGVAFPPVQDMAFAEAAGAYFDLVIFYFGRMTQGGGEPDEDRLIHNADQVLFLLGQTRAGEIGTFNHFKAFAHHVIGIACANKGQLGKGEEHLRACIAFSLGESSLRELGEEAQQTSRNMLEGGLMRIQPCKVNIGGLFQKKLCGYGTSYRCPVCGAWICPNHGIAYSADFWSNHLEGLLCSEACQHKLFAWPAILKTYIEDRDALRLWGIACRSRTHNNNEFMLNGRNVNEYYAKYGAHNHITIDHVPGLKEFQKRAR